MKNVFNVVIKREYFNGTLHMIKFMKKINISNVETGILNKLCYFSILLIKTC